MAYETDGLTLQRNRIPNSFNLSGWTEFRPSTQIKEERMWRVTSLATCVTCVTLYQPKFNEFKRKFDRLTRVRRAGTIGGMFSPLAYPFLKGASRMSRCDASACHGFIKDFWWVEQCDVCRYGGLRGRFNGLTPAVPGPVTASVTAGFFCNFSTQLCVVLLEQESPPIGGGMRNATSLVWQWLSYIILVITCSENVVPAWPCVHSDGRVDPDYNTTPAIYVTRRRH